MRRLTATCHVIFIRLAGDIADDREDGRATRRSVRPRIVAGRTVV
jgi:hypothetical protein